jgi:hypothetical protein
MPGQFYRSKDGMHPFEPGPILFDPNMRHSAVTKRDGELWVFWAQVGEAPERILESRIDLTGDWHSWKEAHPPKRSDPNAAGKAPTLVPSVRSTA